MSYDIFCGELLLTRASTLTSLMVIFPKKEVKGQVLRKGAECKHKGNLRMDAYPQSYISPI